MSVRKGLFFVGLERSLSSIVAFASYIFIARLLTPEEIGLFSVGAATVALAQALRDFGQSHYIIQERNLTVQKLKAVQTVAYITGWASCILLLIIAHPVSRFYDNPALYWVITVLSLNFFILPFGSPSLAVLRREMKFSMLFRIHFAAGLINNLSAVSLAALGFSSTSLVVGSVLGTVVTSLGALIARPLSTTFRPTLNGLAPVFRFGVFSSGSTMLSNLALSANSLVIGKVFGLAPAALYSRGQGLNKLIHSEIVNASFKVLVPSFGQQYRSDISLKPAYSRTIEMLTIIAWPAYAFIYLNAHDLLLFLFGSQWTDADLVTQYLAIAFAIAVLFKPGPHLLTATGKVERLFRLELVQQAVRLVIIVATSLISLEAIAVGMIAFYLFDVLLYWAYAVRPIVGIGFIETLQYTLRSLFCTLACIVSVLLTLNVIEYYDIAGYRTSVAASALICLFTWIASAQIIRHPIATEISNVLRKSFGLLMFSNKR